MAIAKITGNGLVAIAILVACLWGCLLAEHKILLESQKRQSLELNELKRLRDRTFVTPAALPIGIGLANKPFSS